MDGQLLYPFLWGWHLSRSYVVPWAVSRAIKISEIPEVHHWLLQIHIAILPISRTPPPKKKKWKTMLSRKKKISLSWKGHCSSDSIMFYYVFQFHGLKWDISKLFYPTSSGFLLNSNISRWFRRCFLETGRPYQQKMWGSPPWRVAWNMVRIISYHFLLLYPTTTWVMISRSLLAAKISQSSVSMEYMFLMVFHRPFSLFALFFTDFRNWLLCKT